MLRLLACLLACLRPFAMPTPLRGEAYNALIQDDVDVYASISKGKYCFSKEDLGSFP